MIWPGHPGYPTTGTCQHLGIYLEDATDARRCRRYGCSPINVDECTALKRESDTTIWTAPRDENIQVQGSLVTVFHTSGNPFFSTVARTKRQHPLSYGNTGRYLLGLFGWRPVCAVRKPWTDCVHDQLQRLRQLYCVPT